ncbi:MAG: exo-beta-N-acetylmuramidase NamZ domain-containing protein [Desulfobacterales bacterium]
MDRVRPGIEVLTENPHPWVRNARLGLLCNPASVTAALRHSREVIRERFPGQLRVLFSPQHGFFAEKQDNMVESDHIDDPVTGLPVYSLYGESRCPTHEMFENLDVLLVDLQDVGTRVYTFIYTLSYCLETARSTGRRVLVLDRPNPVGGVHLEGSLLEAEWASFVGRYPIPMRHGLTIGEISLLFNRAFGIGAELDVVPMSGWQRFMMFRDTGLPWVAPSPNLPTPESAMVYPGQVIWEGTNLSEGRGTAQPFELFGAPYLDTGGVEREIAGLILEGGVLRPCVFEPTSGKHAGKACNGFQMHVTSPDRFRPFTAALRLLQAIIRLHPGAFEWKAPPYEYEFERLPIDLILGGDSLRRRIEAMEPVESIERSWKSPLERFRSMSRKYQLY